MVGDAQPTEINAQSSAFRPHKSANFNYQTTLITNQQQGSELMIVGVLTFSLSSTDHILHHIRPIGEEFVLYRTHKLSNLEIN